MGDLHMGQRSVDAAGQVCELAAGAGPGDAAMASPATYDAGGLGAPQRALRRAKCHSEQAMRISGYTTGR